MTAGPRLAVAGFTLIFLLVAASVGAQDYDGYFSTLFSVMPDLDAAPGRQSVAELRSRLFVEGLFDPRETWHVRAGLFVDALLGSRGPLESDRVAGDALMRPSDLYVEHRAETFDLRIGMSRVVWGRLDEFQPTDVVNPLDLSRFIFEGRSEARLPVALVRGRAFLPASTTLEAIVVPVFRSGRYDQLDERTSPFSLAPAGIRHRREPAISWRNLQGGARVTSTVARLDWGVSAWRGFEPFPTYVPVLFAPDPLVLRLPEYDEVFPRFTMVGADFETVRGPWGTRGEFAWFHGLSTRSFEGGIGADRRAGNYRVALNAIVSHAGSTNVTLVGWGERTFARETRALRLLAVYDPSDRTAFVRGIAAWSIRDNVSLEVSSGWLGACATAISGSGASVLSLLSRRDFLYGRLKVHF